MPPASRTGVKLPRWSPEDTELLRRLKREHGSASWKTLAILFAASNPQQHRSCNSIKIKYQSLMSSSLAETSDTPISNPLAQSPRATGSRSILSKDQPHGLGVYTWSEEHKCYEEFPTACTQDSVGNSAAGSISQSTAFTGATWNPADLSSHILPYPSEIVDYFGGQQPAPMISQLPRKLFRPVLAPPT